MDLLQPMGSIVYMSPEQLTCITSGAVGGGLGGENGGSGQGR